MSLSRNDAYTKALSKINEQSEKELANADNELLELENAVIEYSQKTASYKKIQEALS